MKLLFENNDKRVHFENNDSTKYKIIYCVNMWVNAEKIYYFDNQLKMLDTFMEIIQKHKICNFNLNGRFGSAIKHLCGVNIEGNNIALLLIDKNNNVINFPFTLKLIQEKWKESRVNEIKYSMWNS